MNTPELQRLERFVLTLIFWCALASVLTLGVQRADREWSDRRVEVAYPEGQLLAQAVSDPVAPARLLAAGATTLVREPYTLADMIEYNLAQAWHPEPGRLQVQLADSQLSGSATIYLGGQVGFSNLRIRIRDNQYLFDMRLPGTPNDLDPSRYILDISKGPMPVGFRRALRLPVGDWSDTKDLDQFTRALASLRPNLVIPDWRGGPGVKPFFRSYLVTPWLRSPIMAIPEFSLPTDAATIVSRDTRHYIVRAYRLSPEAYAADPAPVLVQRLVRAVRERSVRVVYLDFPKTVSFLEQLQFTQTFTQALKRAGYPPQALSKERRIRTGALAQVFLLFGVGAIFYVFIWYWARWAVAVTSPAAEEPQGKVRVIRLRANTFRYVALGTALGFLVLQFEGPSHWGAKAGAWLLVVVAPLMGLMQLEKAPGAARQLREWLKSVALEFGLFLLWSTVGAALISVLLYQPVFVQRLQVFTGVKSSLALPVLLGLVYMFPSLIKIKWWERQLTGKRLWITLGCLLVAGAGAWIVLLRTGNLTSFPGKAWEMQWRDALETWLGVRPRFKEFLIGYPLLLIGLGARRLPKYASTPWPRLFLVAGLLGPISMINSFCHLHTPLWISGLRSVHGLWLGVLLGSVGLALAWWWNGRRARG